MKIKKITTLQLTTTAVLLAICIASQFFKNASIYITGPVVNAAIIICTLACNVYMAVLLSIITPVTAFFIAASPVTTAVPAIVPCIMLGNVILALSICRISGKDPDNKKLIIGMVSGSVLKALFMGAVIAYTLLPIMLPEKMQDKLTVFQTTFSVTQLITALIGSVYAYFIWIPLKKTFTGVAAASGENTDRQD